MVRAPIVVGPLARWWNRCYKAGIGVLIAHAYAAVAGYGLMEVNRERRRYMRDNYPSILEAYYEVNYVISMSGHRREHDALIWEAEDNAAQSGPSVAPETVAPETATPAPLAPASEPVLPAPEAVVSVAPASDSAVSGSRA